MFPTKLAADVSSLEVVAPRNISLAQLLPVADILIKERNDLASRSLSDSPSTPSTPASESSSWRKASTESKFAVASSSSSSSSSPSVVSSSPDVESNTVLSRGATFLLNLLCHFTGNRAYTRSQLSNSEFLERAPSLHSLPLQVSDCINKYNENIIRLVNRLKLIIFMFSFLFVILFDFLVFLFLEENLDTFLLLSF